MKIVKLLILTICTVLFLSCNFDAFFNVGTLEWTLAGTIGENSGFSADTKVAAFYRYSTANLHTDYFDDNFRIISNVIQAENGASYNLNITAPDFDTFENSFANIDIIFWQDENNDSLLTDHENYALAVSSDPDTSIFPLWVSFYSDGSHESSISPECWQAYSQTLVPVSYLDLSSVNIKPYEWELYY